MNKPKGYWTFECCKEEALKYKDKTEFKKYSGSAYTIAYKNGWLNEICSHMIKIRKGKHYWTFELCHIEALKFDNRSDFQKKSGGAYDFAARNNWLDKICSHMNYLRKPNNYWTFELIKLEALKYNKISDFMKKSSGAYESALKNDWLKEISLHMYKINKPNDYWTYELCHIEALKYDNRTDFNKYSKAAYKGAYRKGWVDQICSHMSSKIPEKNLENNIWVVYSYIVLNKYVYTGISNILQNRHNRHYNDKNGTLYKECKKYNINIKKLIKISYNKIFEGNKIIKDYYVQNLNPEKIKLIIEEKNIRDEKLVSKLEGAYLEKRLNEGYIKLNKIKTGGLGSSVKKQLTS